MLPWNVIRKHSYKRQAAAKSHPSRGEMRFKSGRGKALTLPFKGAPRRRELIEFNGSSKSQAANSLFHPFKERINTDEEREYIIAQALLYSSFVPHPPAFLIRLYGEVATVLYMYELSGFRIETVIIWAE